MSRATKKSTKPTKSKTTEKDLGIEDVGDIDNARTWVIYGRSGTGKTTFFSTFPGTKLLLDCNDKGTDSVRDVKGLKVKKIRSREDLEDIYWALKEGEIQFDAICIDTVSALQQVVMEELMADKKRKSKKPLGSWGSMTKQDWGDVASYMKTWLINYRDLAEELDMEVMFIAQDRSRSAEDDEDGDEVVAPEVGPAIMPSIATTLNAAVSIIGNTTIRRRIERYTDAKQKKRSREVLEYALRVGPSPVYVTKLRKPKSVKAPEFIIDPTYDEVLDLIEGES